MSAVGLVMSASDSDWSTGLQIVAAIAVGAAIVGGPLWFLEVVVPLVPIVGAIVGGAIGFVVVSYLMYGR
jgi:hypothetical protein